ncbi:BQ2448_4975 [Microbotryum intermedium]|uniref:BQ2448_4975 protein n=1 Tax=Microbotryum intermedium TaxID=269621 RepID=A0A238FJF1_9BASI|nr:BQ2448_4975 [Microbotryum intermedium]
MHLLLFSPSFPRSSPSTTFAKLPFGDPPPSDFPLLLSQAAGSVTREEPAHQQLLSSTYSLPLTLIAVAWASVASASSRGRGLHSDQAVRHQRLHARAQAGSGHHWSLHQLPGESPRRFVRARRGDGDKAQIYPRGVTTSVPTNLSNRSLTVAEGCTKFYKVKPNDSCYSAIAAANSKLALDEFYAMNPQVDGKCFNLWTGYDYCVEKATTKPKVKVNVASQRKQTTTSKPKAAVKPAVPKPVETTTDDDDEECDADDNTAEPTTTAPAKKHTSLAEKSHAAQAKNTGGAVKAFVAGGTNNKDSSAADNKPHSSAPGSTTQPPTSPIPSPTPSTSSGGSSDPSSIAQAIIRGKGITGFLGKNKNGIISWFRTNNPQDSTNGKSWCFNKYDDNMDGFAPDVTTMLANFGWSNVMAGKMYCGALANFTTSSGRVYQFPLIDGFDSKWTKGKTNAADLTIPAWTKLAGFFRNNKNDVLQDVTWEWTGAWDPRFAFNGGNPV